MGIGFLGGSSPVTYTSKFAYVVNFSDDDVSGYAVNATTGALTPIPGSPFAADLAPVSIAADPRSKFAYVANCGSFCAGGGENYGVISGYTINATTGALKIIWELRFPPGPGDYPESMTVDPAGKFAYVSSGSLWGYKINASTLALTAVPGSPFGSGGSPTVDPTGRFVYGGDTNGMWGYTVSATTGALASISGSPFGPGTNPQGVVVDPTGKFAYAKNYGDGTVLGYTINATSGALTPIPGSPFAAGKGTGSLAVDPTGRFAYATNYFDGTVSGYTINATSGALTPVPGSPFAVVLDLTSVAVDPTGKFAYVGNCGDFCDAGPAGVWGYTINATSGALTPIPGSPFAAGSYPISIAVTGQIH